MRLYANGLILVAQYYRTFDILCICTLQLLLDLANAYVCVCVCVRRPFCLFFFTRLRLLQFQLQTVFFRQAFFAVFDPLGAFERCLTERFTILEPQNLKF